MLEGYTFKQLKPLVKLCLQKGNSVLIFGHPGVGKSTLSAELAADFELPYRDMRIAQRDPAELGGMGFPNKETKTIDWFKPDWFPTVPTFIMLDEINSGVTKLHQSCLYQVMLDGGIGRHKFPKGTMVMGAGNLEEDNAIVTPLSQALHNRCASFILRPSVEEWLVWAEGQGISADYQAWIAFGRDKVLYENTGETAFPSPRSHAKAANAVDGLSENGDTTRKRVISSFIGEAHAQQYMTFLKVYRNVNIKDVVDQGVVPTLEGEVEESFLYAFVYSLASFISATAPSKLVGKRAENIVKVLGLFAAKPEYQSTFFRMLVDMVGEKRGVFDVLRTVSEFSTIASRLSQILSAAA